MKDQKSRKELVAAYKERKIIGGVFLIKNTQNGKILLDAAIDLQGSKNRFDFSQSTGSCVNTILQKDWLEFGSDAYIFEVLEEIEKGELQNLEEFKVDIQLLKELWREKLMQADFY